MVIEAIAAVVLAGLMLIPLVNVVVGGIVGAGFAGPLGGFAGIVLAVAITALETWLADLLGLRDLRPEPAAAAEPVADAATEAPERTIKTGPPTQRRPPQAGRMAASVRRPAAPRQLQRSSVR